MAVEQHACQPLLEYDGDPLDLRLVINLKLKVNAIAPLGFRRKIRHSLLFRSSSTFCYILSRTRL